MKPPVDLDDLGRKVLVPAAGVSHARPVWLTRGSLLMIRGWPAGRKGAVRLSGASSSGDGLHPEPQARIMLHANPRTISTLGKIKCSPTGLQSVPACGLVGQVSLQTRLSGRVLKEMEEWSLVVAGYHSAAGCAVAVENVVKSYGPASSAVFALRGASLQVRRGERVALLGKSGSGKSTLLHLIGGLDRPTSGSIRAGDRDLAGMTADELAAYRLTTVGMIFQA